MKRMCPECNWVYEDENLPDLVAAVPKHRDLREPGDPWCSGTSKKPKRPLPDRPEKIKEEGKQIICPICLTYCPLVVRIHKLKFGTNEEKSRTIADGHRETCKTCCRMKCEKLGHETKSKCRPKKWNAETKCIPSWWVK